MSDQIKNESLFDGFPNIKPEEWKNKMVLDLKGLPYEKLIWKTNEGIEVKPFYTQEDLENLKYLESQPGEFPYLRGNETSTNKWEIRQDILVDNIEKANAAALNALNKGATSIGFILPEDKVFSQDEFKSLLKDIYIECVPINFITHSQATGIFQFLKDECVSRNIDPNRIVGSIDNDPLGYLTGNGNFIYPERDEFRQTAALLSKAASELPNLRMLGINGTNFHNAGGTIIQELGFSLAIISDYLDILSGEGLKPETIAGSMQLNLSVGPVYFMEIAKNRAARFLFAKLVKSWGVESEKGLKSYIHCATSEWNQTIYDPYVNMLRSTTESMSAVLGGCDSLTVTPFDKAIRSGNDFSERIARNTHIILKEEAWLDKVQDPAAGSYFIESLTDSIISESWKLFLEIEEMGGYLVAFKAGGIQERITTSAALRNQNIAGRKETLLGTNQYPNPLENKPEDLNPAIESPHQKNNANLLAEPLEMYRGANEFEKLRFKSEAKKKKVFLLTIGNQLFRKARAGFSAGFFACAGFEVIDNPGFDTPSEGVKAARNANASIVVLCSSDEEYATLAPEVTDLIGKDMILVIAGYPKDCMEVLKSKGITNFIHLKSNVLEELQKYQKMLEL